MSRSLRIAVAVAGLLLATLAVTTLSPDTTVGYVARQAAFQGEMLWGRIPLDEARPGLDEAQGARLDLIPGIQSFGDTLGLEAGRSYGSINPAWDRTIYNVSASAPLAFEPVRWRFPVVGRVPYLGYFRLSDALRRGRALHRRGYDVYIRTAGAYSTLGWFADPILPHMLHWPEGRLAGTLFHERAHATLWIPGSVRFNESFASFVGREAEMRWLVHRYGGGSDEVERERHRRADRAVWRAFLHQTWKDLDAVYEDPDRTPADKRRDKALILAALPTRAAALDLHRRDAYVRHARRGPWNNARLMQFRTYNDNQARFARLLEHEGGDLRAFIDRVEAITRGADDPFAALARAVGEDPVADAD